MEPNLIHNQLNFIPSLLDDTNIKVLYGSSGIYLFLRYLYAIYQRLEVAYHISFHFDLNKRTECIKLFYLCFIIMIKLYFFFFFLYTIIYEKNITIMLHNIRIKLIRKIFIR
jgi:hypothetical protein